MTRLGLAVALTVLAVGVPTASAAPSPSDLEAELVCPTCKTTLDQSDAPVARRMKQIIRAQLAAGATEAEIKADLVDQFGPGVLAEPPKSGLDLLAWIVPLGVLGVGVVCVGAIAWGWTRRRGEPADGSLDTVLDPALERRVDDELDRFDA